MEERFSSHSAPFEKQLGSLTVEAWHLGERGIKFRSSIFLRPEIIILPRFTGGADFDRTDLPQVDVRVYTPRCGFTPFGPRILRLLRALIHTAQLSE